jgi:hypothetical protein
MTIGSNQSNKSSRNALDAIEGLLEDFERLKKMKKIPGCRTEDLQARAQLIKTQLMGARAALQSFIETLETQRGKTISETEAETMILRAQEISALLGCD